MTDLYADLGVPKSATREEIKRAYRERAKDHHPDKGGDQEEFRQVARAYQILSSEERRKRYDAGERPEDVLKNNPDERAVKSLQELFINVVAQADAYTDPIAEIRKTLLKAKAEGDAHVAKQRALITRFEKAKTKLKSKKPENLLAVMLDIQAENCRREIARIETENCRREIARIETELKIGVRIGEILDDYEFEVEQRPVYTQTITIGGIDFGVGEWR